MSHSEYEDRLVDVARHVADAGVEAQVRQHCAECPDCASRLHQEEALTRELRALAVSARAVVPPDSVEAALRTAFRQAAPRHAVGSARSPRTETRPRAFALPAWLAAAAAIVVLLGAAAAWRAAQPAAERIATTGARASARPAPPAASLAAPAPRAAAAEPVAPVPVQATRPARAPAARMAATRRELTGFVPWPGAAALPPVESGQVVRTELPVSVLPLLGLPEDAGRNRPRVDAEVIVAQDGQARAVRLVR